MIAIVLNPASGVASRPHLREEVEELCRNAGMDVRIHGLAHPRDLSGAVRKALDAHPAALIAGGGDGTVSAIAAALAGTSTPLGILPLGTLNHFAKDAGIPLDLQKAVETVAAHHTRRVDVGRVNKRIFINNSSIGIYPSIVAFRERLRTEGHSKWAALALATSEVLRREGEVAIRLQGDRARVEARTPFVFVGNNEYFVEGVKLGSRTRLDAGRLYAYFAPPVRTRHLPMLFTRAVFGLARHNHSLESIGATQLWIDTPLTPTIDVACDGELLTLSTPLHYQSWPDSLTLLAPAG
jgi:diacylglycerol kinase family enzyme